MWLTRSYLLSLSALIAVLCLRHVNASRHHHPSKHDLREFESFVRTAMRCRHIPGMSISIVKGDDVIMSKGFGMADIETGKQATGQTKFFIGSLTKAFTTTLLAKLLEPYKNMTFKTPVREILGHAFEMSDPELTRTATIEDLLLHRLGIPSFFFALLAGFPESIDRGHVLRRLKYLPATAPARTTFMYNNYLYGVAGTLAEHLAGNGRSWENLTRQHIFSPLGMHDSGFVPEVTGLNDFALPYATMKGELKRIPDDLILSVHAVGPAGSIYSTADDMAQWIKLHLSHGKSPVTGKKVLHTKSLEKTYAGQTAGAFPYYNMLKPKFPISHVQMAYGLGWMESNYRGYRMVWHSGGISSYSSEIGILPDLGVGVYLSINGPADYNSRPFRRVIMLRALDMFMGEKQWLNHTTACKFPEPWDVLPEHLLSLINKVVDAMAGPKPLNNKCRNTILYEDIRSDADTDDDDIAYTNQGGNTMSLDAFTGMYGHPFFGEITLNITTVKHNRTLTLWQGRFAHMLLTPENGDTHSCSFSAIYIGPLWYISSGDDASPPETIRFTWDTEGRVISLEYKENRDTYVKFSKDFRPNLDGPSESQSIILCNAAIRSTDTLANHRLRQTLMVLVLASFIAQI